MYILKFFLILSLPLLYSGCIAIPLPPEKEQFTQEIEAKITVGKTNKSEIIALLGESGFTNNDRFLLYKLPRQSFKFFVIIGMAGGGGFGILPINHHDYVILMEFDSTGILQNIVYEIHEQGITINDDSKIVSHSSLPNILTPKQIKIFSYKDDNQVLYFFTNKQPIGFSNIAFSPDGKQMIMGGYFRYLDPYKIRNIYINNRETNETRSIHVDEPRQITFSPDITKVALSVDHTITIMDINSSRSVFKGDDDTFFTVSRSTEFSPDGNLLASSNSEGDISVWNLHNNQKLYTIKKAHKSSINSVSFSNNGHWFATSGYDNNVKIWNTKNGALVYTIKKTKGLIKFSPVYNIFAINCRDHIELWEYDETFSEKVQLNTIFLLPHSNEFLNFSLEFSKDGNFLAAGNGNLVIYDVSQNTEILRYVFSDINKNDRIDAVAFTPDHTHFATATPNGIYLWEIPINSSSKP